MDALSSVLRAAKLSGVIFLRADMRGEYGIKMPPPTLFHPVIKPETSEHRLVMFHIVREGVGWVEVEGCEAQELSQGDLIIVIDDLYHSIVDSPGRETIDSIELAPHIEMSVPPAVRVGESGKKAMQLICGMLQFVKRGFNPLFAALPPYIVIKRDDGPETTWLQTNIAHVIREAESGRPGAEMLLANLTELIFVETVRCYLSRLTNTRTGWLAALNDPIVGQAVQLIHQSPAHGWTVAELAKACGASRSGFAAAFTRILDTSPMTYLTRWRIRLATNLLEEPSLPLAQIASTVGYESESAFSRAFKREMGVAPDMWRRAQLAMWDGRTIASAASSP